LDGDALRDYQTEPMKCLGCGVILDGALEVQSSGEPKPESVSMCVYCGSIAIYTKVLGKLALRHPTDKELKEIMLQPNVRQAIWATAEVRKKFMGE
jgi:hypothetical protein